MLVKSVVCEWTDLPPICIGSFPSTNNRSPNLLNQIWNIFRQKALRTSPQIRTRAHRRPGLRGQSQWPALGRGSGDRGILGDARKPNRKVV